MSVVWLLTRKLKMSQPQLPQRSTCNTRNGLGTSSGAAKVLFGGLPKGVTNGKAIAAYQKAIECRPNVIRYHDELARAYEKIKHSEKAIEQLELALSLTPQTADDQETLRRCRKRLGELKKKCRSESQKAFSMQSTPKPENN